MIFSLPCHRENIRQEPNKHRVPCLPHKGLAIWDPYLSAALCSVNSRDGDSWAWGALCWGAGSVLPKE